MNKLRVLVVDDEEMVRTFLESLLTRRGDRCALASSGQEALRILSEQDFDVLISDLYMPVMSGLELIRQAKSLRPQMVPMILTGQGTTRDSIAAIKEGVFDYIEKPVRDIPAFSMAIDRAGERSRLIRERDRLMADLQRQNEQLEANLASLNEAYERLMRQEEALEADLRRAQRMQQSLLPSGFPHVDGLDFFGYYCPCEHLGGDFFDIIPLGPGRAAVYLADVAGHGVRAAMVTVVVRGLIHAQRMLYPESRIFEDPAKALAFLNKGLMEEEFGERIHVTMGYMVVDGRKGEVIYGGAGHPRPLLVSGQKQSTSLRADGPALGIESSSRFITERVKFDKGDFILLYSDGLTDSRNAEGQELTAPHLAELLGPSHSLPPIKIGGQLEEALTRDHQTAPPSDDVTFVVISRARKTDTAEGQIMPRTVKIVNLGVVRASSPPSASRVARGWANGACVIEISGRATWQQGPSLLALVEEARERGASAIFLDLRACDSLDSTLLGLICHLSQDLTLCGPSDRVLRLFREMGILHRLRVTDEAIPAAEMEEKTDSGAGDDSPSRLILAAHETLMETSPDNRKRFGAVVDLMRKEQDAKSPEQA